MIGFAGDHLVPVNKRVLTKYTSALNGDSKPYFQPFNVERIGILSVVSDHSPGPNVSPNWPRYTNCATCDSRTISFAPRLISFWVSGCRYEMVSRQSSC